MVRFVLILSFLCVGLSAADAQAQKSWNLESDLNGTHYQCASSDDAQAQFKISFERVRRHKSGMRLMAFYDGQLSTDILVNSGSIDAEIEKIDPIDKKYEIDIHNFPSISLFNKGRPRHLKTIAYFNDGLATIEGQLNYVVGRKRDGTRRAVGIHYNCTVVVKTAPVQGQ